MPPMLGPYVAYALLAVVTITALVIDVRTQKIPNKLTVPAIVAGFVWWGLWGAMDPNSTVGAELHECALGFGLGLFGYALIVALGPLGGGDVKLMAAVGAISASWQVVFSATVYACLTMLVLAVIVMVKHGIVKRTLRRLMVAAVMASTKVKPELDGDTPRLPFAAGACVGALLAAGEWYFAWPTPWAAYGLTPQ